MDTRDDIDSTSQFMEHKPSFAHGPAGGVIPMGRGICAASLHYRGVRGDLT
jgi:hypothetical protein